MQLPLIRINYLYSQERCDPSLRQIPDNPLSYHDRNDRCEGIYVQQLGSTTLQVVSFTRSFEAYDLTSKKPLQISWNKFPGKNIIRLRAASTKRKLYYRMDTYCPPLQNYFSWPVNILASLHILKPDIGVIAFTKYSIGGKEKDIYLPLQINQQQKGDDKRNDKITVLPGVELSEIYISIRSLTKDGKTGNYIKKGQKLGYGYYPADRTIDIPIPGLSANGIYCMDIGAVLRTGRTSTIEVFFYNAVE